MAEDERRQRRQMTSKAIEIGSRTIEISNAEKVLFPDDGITEWDLADYYRRIAKVMIPHTADRPISLQRFPHGIDQSGFYAKTAPDHLPDWIERIDVEVLEKGETQPQIVVNRPETLV